MAVEEGNARDAAVADGRRIEERDGGQTPVGEIEERERRDRSWVKREEGDPDRKKLFSFFLIIG